MKKATPTVLIGLITALAFLLIASKCETKTEFLDSVAENCTDKQDNDADGQVDCADSDCDDVCAVNVIIFPVGQVAGDTLELEGTVANATRVNVDVRTTGTVDPVKVVDGKWSTVLRQLTRVGAYTVVVTATSDQGKQDTAQTSFSR